MALQQQLDAFRAELARTAPAGRPALYKAKIEELPAGFAPERAVRTGDQAAKFALPDPQGRTVSLGILLQAGSAVETFFAAVPLESPPAISASITTQIAGLTYHGHYSLDGGVITVFALGKAKTAQLGNTPLENLAQLLLWDIMTGR